METWVKTSLILCVFGFLKEFRPADPFFTQYLVGPALNFTEVQVNQQIYPVMTYSQLSMLVLVFLVTDLLRYKPVILIAGASITLSSVFSAASNDVLGMQMMGFLFGIFSAAEVAYFTYIYAMVDPKHYQKVTSYTNTAYLLGRFTSSSLGQILVSTNALDFRQLIFLTTGALSLATIWAFFLPPANRSIYFHSKDTKDNNATGTLDNAIAQTEIATVLPPTSYTTYDFTQSGNQNKLRVKQRCVKACNHLWKDFKDAFTNTYVFKWSVWSALASCGYYQVIMYSQVLWESINNARIDDGEEPQTLYNGAVDASYTLIGAAAAFGCGWLRFNWQVLGEVTLATCALLQGACIVTASLTTDIYIAYVVSVVFSVAYHAMITIVNAEVAKHINEDSYGLIFGVNTFFALVLQTVLTLAVAGEGGLALDTRTQFLIYGGYFVVLGAIFAVMAVVRLCGGKLRDQPLWLPEDTSNPNS